MLNLKLLPPLTVDMEVVIYYYSPIESNNTFSWYQNMTQVSIEKYIGDGTTSFINRSTVLRFL